MNKYHAKPTFVEGRRFASRKEAGRYCELRLLERDLRQVKEVLGL